MSRDEIAEQVLIDESRKQRLEHPELIDPLPCLTKPKETKDGK